MREEFRLFVEFVRRWDRSVWYHVATS